MLFRSNRVPWESESLKRLRGRVQRRRIRYLRADRSNPRKDDFRIFWRNLQRVYENAMNRARVAYEDKRLFRAKNPQQYFNTMRNMRNKRDRMPSLRIANRTITEADEKAEVFLDQFTIDPKVQNPPDIGALINRTEGLTTIDITEAEIKDSIKSMGNSHAVGQDGVSNRHLKNATNLIVPVLKELFRFCFEHGCLADKIGRAHV